ncbi:MULTISPECIES: OsmC family protein [Paraliobacillus]|uniref:OsmC family protein n=1 Tax=Paraliobacillus TaxID=200903 RepID=UPI000DD35327|nr:MULTISPECIES: OsmC family protein [Paraliobacillus]
MADIKFEANVDWHGTGSDGEGSVTLNERPITFSSPTSMGGKGSGTTPEDLLISAVATCYSGTLYSSLVNNKLPVHHVEVRVEGIVTGYPLTTKFEQLIVHPTIIGGDNLMLSNYKQVADTAKDNCFIGKSIVGNIDYKVGTVEVSNNVINQSVIDALVENFYQNLTKESYYTTMFAERNVDIEKLKARQKIFIARLLNEEHATSDEEQKEQVLERHSYQTTPENAALWLDTMEKSMDEVDLAEETKGLLLIKMRKLMDTMIKE